MLLYDEKTDTDREKEQSILGMGSVGHVSGPGPGPHKLIQFPLEIFKFDQILTKFVLLSPLTKEMPEQHECAPHHSRRRQNYHTGSAEWLCNLVWQSEVSAR